MTTNTESTDKPAVKVGEIVKAKRQAANLTQEELSLRSGLAQSHISQIENGRRNPPIGTRKKLAEAIGCPLHDLLPEAA